MPDSTPLKFSHIGLHVENLENALVFFTEHLQLELLEHGPEQDPLLAAMLESDPANHTGAWLQFPRTASHVRLTENRGAPLIDADHANPGTCHVAFYTHDMEATWVVLDDAGTHLCSTGIVPIVGGVFDGGKAIYCAGPDGIRIEFMEGPAYLDGSPRDPDTIPNDRRANEATHFGLHVRDRDRSLAFYRDLLGLEQVAAWLEKTAPTKAVIGYPEAELFMAILRLPGTHAYMEVIEYQQTSGTPVDNRNVNNGTCHIGFEVDDLDALLDKLTGFGAPILSGGIIDMPDGRRGLCCEDPDGYRVQFLSPKPRS